MALFLDISIPPQAPALLKAPAPPARKARVIRRVQTGQNRAQNAAQNPAQNLAPGTAGGFNTGASQARLRAVPQPPSFFDVNRTFADLRLNCYDIITIRLERDYFASITLYIVLCDQFHWFIVIHINNITC